jgi:hypothetical protein
MASRSGTNIRELERQLEAAYARVRRARRARGRPCDRPHLRGRPCRARGPGRAPRGINSHPAAHDETSDSSAVDAVREGNQSRGPCAPQESRRDDRRRPRARDLRRRSGSSRRSLRLGRRAGRERVSRAAGQARCARGQSVRHSRRCAARLLRRAHPRRQYSPSRTWRWLRCARGRARWTRRLAVMGSRFSRRFMGGCSGLRPEETQDKRLDVPAVGRVLRLIVWRPGEALSEHLLSGLIALTSALA